MLCWGYLSLVLNYFCSAFWIYHFYVLNILSKVLMFQNFNISGFCVTHYYYHYVQYEILSENYVSSLLVVGLLI